MTFEEKKQAVLSVHHNKISVLSGEAYGNRTYFGTSFKDKNGQNRTYKYRTEEALMDKLYEIYFENMETNPVPKYELHEICSIFGFQKDHALFLIHKNKDYLQKTFSDSQLSDTSCYITYPMILWLIAQGCQSTGNGDYSKMQHLIETEYNMTSNKDLETENQKLQNTITAIKNILTVPLDAPVASARIKTKRTKPVQSEIKQTG